MTSSLSGRGRPARAWRARRRRLLHPAQVVVAGFAAAVGVGTLLLLPVSRADSSGASVVDALFTATSAVCVTGLIPGHAGLLVGVRPGRHRWRLIQVGGFGIMALATLLGLLVSRRVGLRNRVNAAAESKSLGLSDVRKVLLGVARTSPLFEAAVRWSWRCAWSPPGDRPGPGLPADPLRTR